MPLRSIAAALLALAIAIPLSCELADDAQDDRARPKVTALDGRGLVATVSRGSFAPPFRFVAYGDSRSHPDRHARVIDGIAAREPALVLFTGDAELSYSPAALDGWLAVVTHQRAVASLVARAAFVVARGNHDSGIEEDARWPRLTRQTAGPHDERYAFSERGVFFVSLGCSLGCSPTDVPGALFLAQALSSAEARAAKWRVVFAHGPIYDSGNTHHMEGYKPLEDLLDAYGVDVHLAGHDHLYERSHQLRGGAVVDRGDELRAGAGTVYVVSGGGGAPFYDASTPLPSSHAIVTAVNHFCELEATDASLSFTARRTDGTPIDRFTIRR
jgi:predicted phosphodiesterase